MSTDREFDVLLRSWLDDATPTREPEGLLESVLATTGNSRPHPVWIVRLGGEPMRETSHPGLNRFAPLALVATALAVTLLVAIGLLLRPSPDVGPPPPPAESELATPSPATASPSATTIGETPSQPSGTALTAGDHVSSLDAGLRITVPAGWINTLDTFFVYDLTGPAGRDAGAISFEAGPFQASDSLDCDGIGNGEPSAQAIVERLASDERLVTSEPRSASIAGLDGFMLDIELDPAWTHPCPDLCLAQPLSGCSTDMPAAGLLTRPSSPQFTMLGIFGDQHLRLFIHDPAGTGTCCSLAIAIYAPDRAAFDAFLTEAMPVVESYVSERH
jgi:hypothetical protein